MIEFLKSLERTLSAPWFTPIKWSVIVIVGLCVISLFFRIVGAKTVAQYVTPWGLIFRPVHWRNGGRRSWSLPYFIRLRWRLNWPLLWLFFWWVINIVIGGLYFPFWLVFIIATVPIKAVRAIADYIRKSNQRKSQHLQGIR